MTDEAEQVTEPDHVAGSIGVVADRASPGLVGRRALVESILLAAVAQEHVVVAGPPGTAKSQAVRQIAEAVGTGISGTWSPRTNGTP